MKKAMVARANFGPYSRPDLTVYKQDLTLVGPFSPRLEARPAVLAKLSKSMKGQAKYLPSIRNAASRHHRLTRTYKSKPSDGL